MRYLLVLAAVLGLLAAAYYLIAGRTAALEGRVFTRDLEDREMPGSGARVVWYPAEIVAQQMASWLSDYDRMRRENSLSLRAARNEWDQKVALREEAARILRVAERSNSADVDICRARHREAAADTEEALRRLQALEAAAAEATDPARFVAGLPTPSFEVSADPDGRFRIEVPHGERGFVFASLADSGRKEGLVWWREVIAGDGEKLEFSNGNVLTAATVAGMARAQKKAGEPEGPPAE